MVHYPENTPHSPSRMRDRLYLDGWVYLLFMFLALALYGHALRGSFYFDDMFSINHEWESIKTELFRLTFFKHRLIPALSFLLDRKLHGLDVGWFRLTNLGIHILNTGFIYILAKKLFQETNQLPLTPLAFPVALLFLIHPVQTNAVTYVVQRMELLASLFYVMGFLCFIQIVHTRHWKWLIFLLIAFLLGVWSKAIIWTLPLTCGLYILLFKPSLLSRRSLLWLSATLSILGILAWIWLSKNNYESPPAWSGPAGKFHWGIIENLLTQATVIVTHYLKILLIPWPGWMALEHDHVVFTQLWGLPMYSSILLLGLWALAFLSIKKRPLITFGIFWYFIILLPSSSLIPLPDVIVEYRNYLPSVGIWLALVACLQQILGARWRITMLFIPFFLFCGYSTYQRNQTLQNDLTMWNDVVSKYPFNPRAQLGLANAYYDRKNFTEALYHYRMAHQLKPSADALHNMASIHGQTGNIKQAIAYFQQAVVLESNRRDQYLHWKDLGGAYWKMGKPEQAERAYLHAYQTRPEDMNMVHQLTNFYIQTRQYEKGIQFLDGIPETFRQQAGFQLALAKLYLAAGQPDLVLHTLTQAKDMLSDSNMADVTWLMGMAHYQLQHISSAKELLNLFLQSTKENDPRKAQAKQILSSLGK